MTPFEFRDYLDRRANAIDALLSEWGSRVRAEFDSMLGLLAITPMGQWARGYTDKLHGRYRTIREFRVKVERVQYRLYGFDSAPHEITLVCGLRKTGSDSDETSAHEQALRRKANVESEEAKTVPHA